MIADYLAAEALIIARLEDRLAADGVKVLAAADLAGVEERKQIVPAVHVLYDGDRLGQSVSRGIQHQVYQRWFAVVAVRNARGQATGAAARSAAGPLITKTIQALAGWAPSSDHQPLVRVSAPRPRFSPGGFAYFPLAFETRIETGGSTP